MSSCDDSDEGNGFVLSLQPFYTEADLDCDPGLVGSWTDKEGDVTFSFEQGKGPDYRLVVQERNDGEESSAEFEAHLVRLGPSSFVDLLPDSAVGRNEFHQMHLFRAHSIARIELSQDTMHMAFFNGAWLQKKIEEKSIGVSFQRVDGTLLLTGTTKEAQDLVYLHTNDDDAFSETIALTKQE